MAHNADKQITNSLSAKPELKVQLPTYFQFPTGTSTKGPRGANMKTYPIQEAWQPIDRIWLVQGTDQWACTGIMNKTVNMVTRDLGEVWVARTGSFHLQRQPHHHREGSDLLDMKATTINVRVKVHHFRNICSCARLAHLDSLGLTWDNILSVCLKVVFIIIDCFCM